MTTYSYTLVLGDTECMMLEDALKMMIEHCEKQIVNAGPAGPEPPYLAYKGAAEEVKERLYAKVRQTSGNNFGQYPIDSGD